MNRQSPASRLFHLLYPTSNYYGASSEMKEKMQRVAREFEEYLKENKKNES